MRYRNSCELDLAYLSCKLSRVCKNSRNSSKFRILERSLYRVVETHGKFVAAIGGKLWKGNNIILFCTFDINFRQNFSPKMPVDLKPMRYAHSEGHTDVCYDDSGRLEGVISG